jgi:hypothetical protein
MLPLSIHTVLNCEYLSIILLQLNNLQKFGAPLGQPNIFVTK